MEKKRRNKAYSDRFNDSVAGWHQPNDLDLVRMKPKYSPVGTPPRLRTYVIFFFLNFYVFDCLTIKKE